MATSVAVFASLALVLSACSSEQLAEIETGAQQAADSGELQNAAQEVGDGIADAAQGAGDAGGGDTGGGDTGGGDTGGGDTGGGDTGGGDTGGGDTGGGAGTVDTTGIPSTDPNTGGGTDSNTPWWLVAILLGLTGLLIGFILRGNRARRDRPAPRQNVAAPPATTPIDEALSTAQWMVDDLSIDVSNPQTQNPQQRMQSAAPRLDDAHIAFINQYQTTGNEVWNDLSRELSATRSSLEQYAGIVGQPNFDQNTAQQSAQVVNQHRTQMSSLVQQGWNALRAGR